MPTLTVRPFFKLGELRDFFNLASEFADRIHSFLKIQAGVRSLAGDFDDVLPNSFARGLDGALSSVRRLRAREPPPPFSPAIR